MDKKLISLDIFLLNGCGVANPEFDGYGKTDQQEKHNRVQCSNEMPAFSMGDYVKRCMQRRGWEFLGFSRPSVIGACAGRNSVSISLGDYTVKCSPSGQGGSILQFGYNQ